MYGPGGHTLLILGKFNAMIQVHGHVIDKVVYVIPGLNNPLLGQPAMGKTSIITTILLTLSAHVREGYSSRPVCLSAFLSRSDFGDY